MEISCIKNDSIIIVPLHLREKFVLYLNKNTLFNYKILSFEEIKNSCFFSYDFKAINFVMTNYNVNYSTAIKYLDSLIYTTNNINESKKLDLLNDIKSELSKKNLLILDDLFTDLLKSKEICYVYGFDELTKFEEYLLDILKNYIKVEIISKKRNNYETKIYELPTIEKECEFVAESISNLISDGVPINNIYIANTSTTYYKSLRKVFNFYGIPISLKNDSFLFETEVGKYFLNNLSLSKNSLIKNIKDNYINNTDESLEIYKIIVNFINRFYWVNNLDEISSLVENEFKKIKLPIIKYKNSINEVEITDNLFQDDEYVFLMNFNLNEIPKTVKDEDFISDKIKPPYLNTSDEINTLNKNKYLSAIKSIKNLTITYKVFDNTSTVKISYLNNYLNFEVIKIKNNISNYSDMTNRINLATLIDNKIKYNQLDDDLGTLYSNYKIDYDSYSNKFNGIDKTKLLDTIKDKLSFSSSNIDTYYSCPFKFYNSNILKISKYEQNFGGKIGTFFHYCLENMDKISLKEAYENYINNENNLTNKEKFFIRKSLKDIELIIEIIKNQKKHSKHKLEEHEKKIEVTIKRNVDVTLKGFIDKIFILDNKVMIIDYKTNNQTVDPDYFDFGLKLQLPIYHYLLKSCNPDIKIAGLFIEHLVPNKPNLDENELKNFLRLDGIFTTDIDILKDFDDTYENSEIIKHLRVDSKTGEIKTSKYAFSSLEFDDLFSMTEKKIYDCIDNVFDGNFSISPINIKDKYNACDFCEFKDVCYKKFDDIKYVELKKEEIIDE